MRNNIFYLVLLVISAAVFTVFICPYLESRGLAWICVLFYIVVVIIFLYGRAAVVKQRGPR